ncbi:nucleoside-diphosphate-sugar epimerase family protein [Aspergillus homomorphus CBS 101889]|uniref:Nucleoside-diphosphate-sugar epimerase family protein n=1 Tax=Aspergillus homomorphus (strain CBS 101889) TaxID=1450537 RepID=A0A395I466_ASPHC|nr:nucleoside-diphosphate-sugar epimerase family protein [Aspergillus homomorphus CBS 101889]RAL14767.1 nucleoside-diphosphate-sugar epimerase family protein [Aspergillus homomorphus CBS 101889]
MTAILVTGATGKQGGSLIKSLVTKNAPYEILAVTRNSQSTSAQRLSQLSSKIKLVEGNLDNPAGIFSNAHKVTQAPIWGVFSVQVAIGNGAQEEAQGKALVDEALKQNVKFFVYSSVDRGGDASFRNPTDIPHFQHKHNIEHHLVEKSKNTEMKWFILRPTAFFENLVPGLFGKVFATCFKMALKGKPLQLVATSDIGYFGADGFLHPEAWAGRDLSLAGDEITYDQMAKIFQQKTGQWMPSTFRALCSLFMASMKDMGYMFKWFHDEGYKADIPELKRLHPNLKDFGTWLETESEFKMK